MRNNFYIDLRALALMRMAAAIVILIDLGIRMWHLEAFYSNTGAVPLALLFQHNWNDFAFSLHAMSGMWQFELLLFLVNMYCAVMLFIGKQTRIYTFLCWIFLISLHNRNPLILQGGDDLLRMLLFWGMFLPWHKKYAVDSINSAAMQHQNTLTNLAALAYVLQLVYLYSFSALLKGPEWNSDFTAVYYAFSFDQIAYPTTKLIYYYPELLKHLTAIAYYFELLVPLLFFIPVFNSQFRLIAFFLVLGFHLFNGSMLQIGLFFVIGIVSAIGILPMPVMDRFDKMLAQFKPKIALIFMLIDRRLSFVQVQFNKSILSPAYRKFIPQFLTSFFLIYILIWNLSNFSFMKYKLNDQWRSIGYLLRLDQNWGMFAPGVIKDNGWYILEGTLTTGKKIDLWNNGAPLSYARPRNSVYLYPNDRWRKYGENMIMQRNAYMRGYFCNYSLRIWNEAHPDKKINSLSVIYMYHLTQADYKQEVPKKQILCSCLN
jgi:Vitamin K-dependent gamma-carboxylase